MFASDNSPRVSKGQLQCVFDLDADLVGRYEAFARSFTTIRAEDIRTQVEEIYRSGKFLPEPLIGVNPHFEQGRSLADLAAQGVVDSDTPKVFAVGSARTPIDLHKHQDQALSKALQNRNYVVTTGTGSGKSLCFFELQEMERVVADAPDRQISLTDPDARAMASAGKGTGLVGYNLQAAVDADSHIIVAHEVTNVGHDRSQLANMGRKAREAIGSN